MKRFFSFLTGFMAGAVVGATMVMLFTPQSGEQLRADARARWEQAIAEAKQAMEDTRREKELEFEQMKEAGKLM